MLHISGEMIPVQMEINTWNSIISHQPATVSGTKKNSTLNSTKPTSDR